MFKVFTMFTANVTHSQTSYNTFSDCCIFMTQQVTQPGTVLRLSKIRLRCDDDDDDDEKKTHRQCVRESSRHLSLSYHAINWSNATFAHPPSTYPFDFETVNEKFGHNAKPKKWNKSTQRAKKIHHSHFHTYEIGKHLRFNRCVILLPNSILSQFSTQQKWKSETETDREKEQR